MLIIGQEAFGVDLREYAEVKNSHFVVKLLILVVLVSGFIALTVMTSGVLSFVGMFLLGLMYAHAIELQHQALHNTALTSKKWNRGVGVVLGMPLLVSFSDYQHSHLRHHRLLGTAEDKEFFNYGYDSLKSLRALIPHLFMVRHYRDVAVYIFQSIFGGFTRNAKEKTVNNIRNEYRLFALFLVAMAVITALLDTTLFLKIWFIPLLVGVPTHALIELPEHIGCSTRTTDVLRNTRSIRASWLGIWFTNGNNYHVEHHWLPGVPNHRWAEIHSRIETHIETLDPSYVSFYWNFVKHLFKPSEKSKASGY